MSALEEIENSDHQTDDTNQQEAEDDTTSLDNVVKI